MDTLARIRLLTGDDPFWNQQNPTLLKGEVGFRNVEGDDPLMRVGDGVRPWNQLPDMNKIGLTGEPGPIGPIGPIGPRGPQGAPGDQTSPFTVPFRVNDPDDVAMMQLDESYDGKVGPLYWSKNGWPGDYMQWENIWAEYQSGRMGPLLWWRDPSIQSIVGVYFTPFEIAGSTGPKFGCMSYTSSASTSTVMAGHGDDGRIGLLVRGSTGYTSCVIYANNMQTGDNILVCQSLNAGFLSFAVGASGSLWAGNLGVGTSGDFLQLGAGGQIIRTGSSARYKTDVHSVPRAQAKEIVAHLRPVSFRSTCKADDRTLQQIGLIAEEVAAIDERLVTFDKEGRPFGVHYDRVAMLLLPLVQELLGLETPGETYG